MKATTQILSLSLLLLGLLISPQQASAKSGAIELHPGKTHSLEQCRGEAGTVKMSASGQNINVVFKDVTCAKFDVFVGPNSDQVYKSYKLTGKTMPRSASFSIPKAVLKAAKVKIRLRSNSGKHADVMYIYLAPERSELTIGAATPLSQCGGSVKVSVSDNAGKPQVNVVLANVKACKDFVVESNNGRAIGKSYAIGGKNGNRKASFTLSWKKVIDKGNWGFVRNDINLKVSGPGGVEDLFTLSFDVN